MAGLLKDIVGKLTGIENGEEEVNLEEIEDISNGNPMEEDINGVSNGEKTEEDINLEENITEPDETMERQAQGPARANTASESEIEEIREEIEEMEQEIQKILSKHENTEERLEELEKKLSKTYMIYETVFQDINPFKEDYDFEEDIHGVLEDFLGEGESIKSGEMHLGEEEKEKISELEDKVENLEEMIKGDGETTSDDVEEEYKEAFEEGTGESEAKWDPGDPVLGPEGEELIITEREWDSEEEAWKYDCKPMGGE
uniref:Uncharacterized protein n=1 Tax=uncultured organism TaxID=155900 RepID=M1Q2P6_9ZZZZ|nr:hypothetical protein FLSS-10_0002 [uncultured organism]